MAKLLTESLVHVMQQPYKSEFERIKENTDENGDILCIDCESGHLEDYEKPTLVSVGFTKPKEYKLQTYFCNNCEYYHIDDNDTANIRKFLSK
jgi:hypothetical protein